MPPPRHALWQRIKSMSFLCWMFSFCLHSSCLQSTLLFTGSIPLSQRLKELLFFLSIYRFNWPDFANITFFVILYPCAFALDVPANAYSHSFPFHKSLPCPMIWNQTMIQFLLLMNTGYADTCSPLCCLSLINMICSPTIVFIIQILLSILRRTCMPVVCSLYSNCELKWTLILTEDSHLSSKLKV